MRLTTTSAALGLFLALFIGGCAEDEEPVDPVQTYLIDTWGITTTGFEDWDGTQFVVEDDGTAVSTGAGVIHVRGLGSAEVSVEERVEPQSRGGVTTALISLVDTADDIFLTFDPTVTELSFGDGESGMGIDANPDGTFRVWRYVGASTVQETLAVTDGVGAYQHVEANGGLEDDSPYILLMAFALGQSPVYEARIQIKCHSGLNRTASPPVPCELFREFCECVACHAKDGIGCTPCPTLDR